MELLQTESMNSDGHDTQLKQFRAQVYQNLNKRDRPKAGKKVVKWLWGSLTTAPQPTQKSGEEK
jgi:hypothetical protein